MLDVHTQGRQSGNAGVREDAGPGERHPGPVVASALADSATRGPGATWSVVVAAPSDGAPHGAHRNED